MKNLKHLLIAGGVIVVLLIALLINMFITSKHTQPAMDAVQNNQNANSNANDNNSNNANTNTSEATPPNPQATDGKFSYEYVMDGNIGNGQTDGKIYKIDNSTKERTLFVPSLKSLMSKEDRAKYNVTDPANDVNWILYQIAASPTHPFLYFTVAFEEGGGGILKFDGGLKKLTSLKTSDYNSNQGATGSKNGLFLASIYHQGDAGNNGRILYLVDLEKDTVKTLVQLPVGQTFNICGLEGCLGDTGATVTWLNDTQFNIDIYSSKPTSSPEGPKAQLLETRKFTVQ